MTAPKFQHVVSLGQACSTAAALSRLGLRESSGPFDWIISNIQLNMTLIKNHFEDFLNPDNLVHRHHPLNNGQYFDQKYNIGFIHDFDPLQDAPPLSEQIEGVQAKYRRRIDYLYRALNESVLLVKGIGDYDAAYINEHIDELRAYIKSYHPNNEFLFFCQQQIDHSKYPNIKIHEIGFNPHDHISGKSFDDDPTLIAYLTDPANYPVEKRAKNLDFFINKQLLIDDNINFNELRIEKERVDYENKAFVAWVEAMNSGRKLTDILIDDGIKKVGLLGANEFTRILINTLKESDIEPVFVAGWRVAGEEFCGVPIRHRVHKPLTDEERKKFEAEDKERAEKGLPPRRHRRHNFLKALPNIEEVDAVIVCDFEMGYFMTQRAQEEEQPCKIYTLTDIVGAEPVYVAPRE